LDIYFECGPEKWAWLPEEAARRVYENGEMITAIRLRVGKPLQLVYKEGDELLAVTDKQTFMRTVSKMLGHSLYARQKELAKGYFTLADGSRAGISGNFAADGPRMLEDISGINIRIAREVIGCADCIMDVLAKCRGAVIISPPGMGKTTVLRDAARQLSERGMCVCVIDERDELAACRNGIASFDLGPRTDVITGLPKHLAIMQAVRSCAPDVIIADEIGEKEDAAAIYDALRCGVNVIASAHGDSLDKYRMRPVLADIIEAVGTSILLGPEIGMVKEIRRYGGGKDNV